MYTQCPTCAALYRVKDELIAASERHVRCGMCLTVFDAGRRCAAQLPAAMQKLVTEQDFGEPHVAEAHAATDAMLREPASLRVEPSADPLLTESTHPDVNLPLADDWHLASALELESRGVAQRNAGLGLAGWGWAFGILCLIVTLVLQVAWFQRDALAAYPELRLWLERGCALAGCQLPLREERGKLRMVRSQVTEHPKLDGVLVATAVIVNEADFRQPYPLLRLSLLDENQRVSGERWFHPADYLDDPGLRTRWKAGMPSDHPVAVRMELIDPGTGSAQYRFDFR